jgi:hypothetical protein
MEKERVLTERSRLESNFSCCSSKKIHPEIGLAESAKGATCQIISEPQSRNVLTFLKLVQTFSTIDI